MTGNAALYQVAVALIPALLFGGAALQLREESPDLRNRPLVGIVVTIILFAGVLAETIAIRGAIDPDLSKFEQRYLVFVVTLGTAGFAYWIAAPMLPRKKGERVSRGRVLVGIALGFAAVLGQFGITDSLNSSSAHALYDEVAKQRFQIQHEMSTAEGDDSGARARLIAVARSTRSSDLAVRIVLARFGRLDNQVLSAAHDATIDASNVNKRMVVAFRALDDVDESFKRRVKYGMSELNRGERELLLLAERPVISAVRSEMEGGVNETLAEQRFESACEAVGLQRCRPRVIHGTTVVPIMRSLRVARAHAAK